MSQQPISSAIVNAVASSSRLSVAPSPLVLAGASTTQSAAFPTRCPSCDLYFPSSSAKTLHRQRAHTPAVEVEIGRATYTVARMKGVFTCPGSGCPHQTDLSGAFKTHVQYIDCPLKAAWPMSPLPAGWTLLRPLACETRPSGAGSLPLPAIAAPPAVAGPARAATALPPAPVRPTKIKLKVRATPIVGPHLQTRPFAIPRPVDNPSPLRPPSFVVGPAQPAQLAAPSQATWYPSYDAPPVPQLLSAPRQALPTVLGHPPLDVPQSAPRILPPLETLRPTVALRSARPVPAPPRRFWCTSCVVPLYFRDHRQYKSHQATVHATHAIINIETFYFRVPRGVGGWSCPRCSMTTEYPKNFQTHILTTKRCGFLHNWSLDCVPADWVQVIDNEPEKRSRKRKVSEVTSAPAIREHSPPAASATIPSLPAQAIAACMSLPAFGFDSREFLALISEARRPATSISSEIHSAEKDSQSQKNPQADVDPTLVLEGWLPPLPLSSDVADTPADVAPAVLSVDPALASVQQPGSPSSSPSPPSPSVSATQTSIDVDPMLLLDEPMHPRSFEDQLDPMLVDPPSTATVIDSTRQPPLSPPSPTPHASLHVGPIPVRSDNCYTPRLGYGFLASLRGGGPLEATLATVDAQPNDTASVLRAMGELDDLTDRILRESVQLKLALGVRLDFVPAPSDGAQECQLPSTSLSTSTPRPALQPSLSLERSTSVHERQPSPSAAGSISSTASGTDDDSIMDDQPLFALLERQAGFATPSVAPLCASAPAVNNEGQAASAVGPADPEIGSADAGVDAQPPPVTVELEPETFSRAPDDPLSLSASFNDGLARLLPVSVALRSVDDAYQDRTAIEHGLLETAGLLEHVSVKVYQRLLRLRALAERGG